MCSFLVIVCKIMIAFVRGDVFSNVTMVLLKPNKQTTYEYWIKPPNSYFDYISSNPFNGVIAKICKDIYESVNFGRALSEYHIFYCMAYFFTNAILSYWNKLKLSPTGKY
jgi:hypothetical protein